MSEQYNDDGSIDENWLAEQIAEIEGKTDEQDIGEIKEQLKITLGLLANVKEEGDAGVDGIEFMLQKHLE